LFIKSHLIYNRKSQFVEQIHMSDLDFFDRCYKTDRKYLFEYYQYNDSVSLPEQHFTYDKELIKKLKDIHLENDRKYRDGRKDKRIYPSLCSIENIFENSLAISEVNKVWENVWL